MEQNNMSPATGDTPQSTQEHCTTASLSITQSRIVNLLLKCSYSGLELEKLAFCRYAPDVIQRIRSKGINIITTSIPHERIDGKIVQIGQYSLSPETKELARQAAQ